MNLERGVFTISLDFELLWGTRDKYGPGRFERACKIEREQVIDRLLNLLVEFEMQATWCVVGHLMLDHCACENGVKHKEIIPPRHAWHPDWFAHDPCSDEESSPLYYGRKLIEKIQRCPVQQEIGSHTFSHVIFGDPGCSEETARSELAACVDAAKKIGIEMQSFVFARNSIGYLHLLPEFGFRCYRGREPQQRNQRFLRFLTVLAATDPPVVLPEQVEDDLWNLPASMFFFPMHGIRRFVPMHLRVKRATKGLDSAANQKKIFHLWFHPTNLSDHMEIMFQGLREILEHARSLRDRQALDFLPMKSLIPVKTLEA
jgi:peptidoglycan/xylan/chitin deacetylase (PgdA/CDA1 family)